jgi:hypothetical protein
MHYEVLVRGNIKGKSKKYCKWEKSKAVRTANRRIVILLKKGDEHRAYGVTVDPKKGWCD